MPETRLAYFLTFSCYGQRLHGDIRGTSDRTGNVWDSPPIGRDDRRNDANSSLMNAKSSHSTRRLRAELLVAANQPIWARHGSTVYLWNDKQVEDSCAYVLDGQGGDLPGSPQPGNGAALDDRSSVDHGGHSAIRSLPVAAPTTRSGLCDSCHYARSVVSAKGSTFVLCALAKVDPRFRKYPSLPVQSCEGYQPRDS